MVHRTGTIRLEWTIPRRWIMKAHIWRRVVLVLSVAVIPARGDDPSPSDDPAANPARPTVSTPASLPPVGYIQFESGSLGATTSPEFATRVGVNNVTKLALNSCVELFVQTDPYIHSTFGSTQAEIHSGEVFVGTQVVVFRDKICCQRSL
jgi:hypothetical protein